MSQNDSSKYSFILKPPCVSETEKWKISKMVQTGGNKVLKIKKNVHCINVIFHVLKAYTAEVIKVNKKSNLTELRDCRALQNNPTITYTEMLNTYGNFYF